MKCPMGTMPYVVGYGETLYSISQKFRTSIALIQRLNPYVDPYNIYPGLMLCVPKVTIIGPIPIIPIPPVTKCKGFIYTVKSGDTLYKIAKRFDLSIAELQKANPTIDINALNIGQKICIPKPPQTMPQCASGKTYTIKPGDNLSLIAEELGYSATDILKANPNMSPSDFTPGKKICLPSNLAPVSSIYEDDEDEI